MGMGNIIKVKQRLAMLEVDSIFYPTCPPPRLKMDMITYDFHMIYISYRIWDMDQKIETSPA